MIRYYGCSAEEGGSGKAFMARAGVFNEIYKEIYSRIADIAKGAALMTGTTFKFVFDGGCSEIVPNK